MWTAVITLHSGHVENALRARYIINHQSRNFYCISIVCTPPLKLRLRRPLRGKKALKTTSCTIWHMAIRVRTARSCEVSVWYKSKLRIVWDSYAHSPLETPIMDTNVTSIVLSAVVAATVYCGVQAYQWWRQFRRITEPVKKFPGLPRSLLLGNLCQVRGLDKIKIRFYCLASRKVKLTMAKW